MPVLLHRTESKRDPCAAWFSTGRPDIPQVHREIHTDGFEEIECFIYALLAGFLGVGCRQQGLTILLTPKNVSAIRHDEANKSARFLSDLPNGLQIAGLNIVHAVRPSGRPASSRCSDRIGRLYVSPAQQPRARRNVCDCELPLSRMRRCH